MNYPRPKYAPIRDDEEAQKPRLDQILEACQI